MGDIHGRGDDAVAASLGLASNADLERLRNGVRALLRAELPDQAMAEDLCHDAFRIVLERLARRPLEDPTRLDAYLAQTARYLAAEQRKRNARRQTFTGQPAALEAAADPAADHDLAVQREQQARAVREVLEQMRHPRDREILVRVYLHDQDKLQVCRELGINEGHYKRVLHRARERFAVLLHRRHRPADLYCIALI